MKAFCVESIGDSSSGVYVRDDKKDTYKLLCIIDPDSAEDENHTWPVVATQEDVTRWCSNCTVKKVDLKKVCLCRVRKNCK